MIKKFEEFLNESFSFKNINTDNLDDILKDPSQQFISENMCKDCCHDLALAVISRAETDGEYDDTILAKTTVFLGVNFSMYPEIVRDEFVEKILEGNKTSEIERVGGLDKFRFFWLTLHAAWPTEEDFNELSNKDVQFCIKIMKKYFPWRLSESGEINWLLDSVVED